MAKRHQIVVHSKKGRNAAGRKYRRQNRQILRLELVTINSRPKTRKRKKKK